MAPHELRNETLKQLRATQKAMTSLEFLLSVHRMPPKKIAEATMEMSRLQIAIYRLRSAQLEDIRNQLLQNEEELERGIAAMRRSLKTLEKVEQILGCVTSLLGVVGRVVAISG